MLTELDNIPHLGMVGVIVYTSISAHVRSTSDLDHMELAAACLSSRVRRMPRRPAMDPTETSAAALTNWLRQAGFLRQYEGGMRNRLATVHALLAPLVMEAQMLEEAIAELDEAQRRWKARLVGGGNDITTSSGEKVVDMLNILVTRFFREKFCIEIASR